MEQGNDEWSSDVVSSGGWAQEKSAEPESPENWPVWPVDVAQLCAWLKTHAGVVPGNAPMITGHSAPLDYIVHAFFEGGALLADNGQIATDSDQLPVVDAVVWANRGGGKTYLGAVATLLDLVFKPGIEVRILGGSLEQSRRMHTHLRGLLGQESLSWMVDGKITDKRIRLLNGSSVELLAQSQTSVRGTRVQKLRCDEVELFTPDLWEAAQLVTRSLEVHPVGRGPMVVRGSIEAISTMHRPYGLMQQLVDEAAEGKRRLFRWGVADVLEHCGPQHVCKHNSKACVLWEECAGRAKQTGRLGHVRIEDALRLKGRVGVEAWATEMLSQRPRRSDSVLPEFDERTHVVQSIPADLRGTPWVCGMDFGFRSPTVVLWAQVDANGVLWVQAERVEAEVVLDEHIKAILGGPGIEPVDPKGEKPITGGGPLPAWIAVDPAGNQCNDQTGHSAVKLMKEAKLTVHARTCSIKVGLNMLRARLRPASGEGPRLFVHQRCTRLIESLVRYHYPSDPQSTTPVKDGHDHAVDALRYLVQTLDQKFETRTSCHC
jgi:hypothetical protein